jgi:hypothetical protein
MSEGTESRGGGRKEEGRRKEGRKGKETILKAIKMIARTTKKIIRRKIQRKMKELKFPQEAPYIGKLVFFF